MAVIVKDTFNRDDNTTLGNAETGQAWIYSGRTYGIKSNEAYLSGGSGSTFAFIDSGLSDCKITWKMGNFTLNNRIIFRYADASNYLAIEPRASDLRIYKFINNVSSSIGTISHTRANGDSISVDMVGNALTFFVNGIQKTTVTITDNITATKHGLYANNLDSTATYDEFIVEDFNTGGGDTGTTHDGQATLTGAGSLSASGKREQLGTINLLAQSLLQADSQAIRQATANLLASGILTATADGVSIITASANLLGSGLLNATGKREQLGASSLIGQGVLNVDTGDVTIITASADLRGSGRLSADSQRIAQAVSSLIGNGLLDSVGQRIVNSQASLLGGGLLQADSYRIVIVDASLVGSGILAVLDGEPVIGTIRLKGDITLNVYLVGKRELNVNLQGKQSLNVHLKGAIQ